MEIAEVSKATLPLLERGLRALAADLGDPYRMPTEALALALFGGNPTARGLVGTQDRALLGVAVFSPVVSTMYGATGVYVSDLWIADAARGKGLGRQLLAAAIARGNASFLRLAVYDGNAQAIDFYRKLGMESVGGQKLMQISGAALTAQVRTQ